MSNVQEALACLVAGILALRLLTWALAAAPWSGPPPPTIDELADPDCPLFHLAPCQGLPAHYSMLEVEERARIAAHLSGVHHQTSTLKK
jgi:hypothetical protein